MQRICFTRASKELKVKRDLRHNRREVQEEEQEEVDVDTTPAEQGACTHAVSTSTQGVVTPAQWTHEIELRQVTHKQLLSSELQNHNPPSPPVTRAGLMSEVPSRHILRSIHEPAVRGKEGGGGGKGTSQVKTEGRFENGHDVEQSTKHGQIAVMIVVDDDEEEEEEEEREEEEDTDHLRQLRCCSLHNARVPTMLIK